MAKGGQAYRTLIYVNHLTGSLGSLHRDEVNRRLMRLHLQTGVLRKQRMMKLCTILGCFFP